MERLELDYRLILFITLLSNHATISSSSTITQPLSNPLQEIVCAAINCGQGTCKASNASLLGFDCECYPGWKKIQIGPLTFPSCLLPNCTVDFQCGKGSPPPSPPPPPVSLPPPLNLSNRSLGADCNALMVNYRFEELLKQYLCSDRDVVSCNLLLTRT
ncbi:hypothetical protein FEM48_Zijuj01G0299100 [Ziziphus jujuba var. spinosa]|uniref:EGF-like domain-containing protein n=1 Tax=Ziziphus jujuba var. spinosa TaxID=714518 RepID=A0A978W5V4_ZIZJJ|nr:hypothetical protein FEM48_Zijuj01G0299100 [Ziziphus jujuba var. spinosa]